MKPLLAATVEDIHQLKYPLYASAKLDGVRALIIDGQVMSRKLKLIPNLHVQKLFGQHRLNGLDGELIVGTPTHKNCLTNTTSGVMSIEGNPEVHFYVFDCFRETMLPFRDRLLRAAGLVEANKKPGLEFHYHQEIEGPDDLELFQKEALIDGYEGVILRDPRGRYKMGRSTLREGIMMKLKQFTDSEGIVLRCEELERNENEATIDALGKTKRSKKKEGMVKGGMLGALIIRDIHDGTEVRLGTGFTEEQRKQLWAERTTLGGVLVKYKHFEIGRKDKARNPVFLGFRSSID